MTEFIDHNVFLSYSRNNVAEAKQIQQLLLEKGIAVWRDQESIYGGQQWPKAIGEGIANHSLFVLLWSKEAANSHFVEFEWNTALALRKVLIPVQLDETPLPPSLQAIHSVSYISFLNTDYLQEQLTKITEPDLDQQNKVIEKLGQIPAGSSQKVAAEAKALFQQEGWKVGGNVYQIHGGNVTINSPTGTTDKNIWYKKLEFWLATLVATVLIVAISIYRSENTSDKPDNMEEFYLTVEIYGPKGVSDVIDPGKVRLQLGDYHSSISEVDNGVVNFVNIPQKYIDDTVKLEMLSGSYHIIQQSAYTPKESRRIKFNIQPEVEYLQIGGIVYENGKRIAGAIVEFDSGLAKDTTGVDGIFDLTLPKKQGEFSVLSIIYNGQERFRREIMLSKNELFLTLDPL
ncbi:toll/interleukin-1 receptor domain-containing protein [Algoriphagus sp. D3-2-R+10]|uniref:toll/interleukin-1 receptor domain-containing protein n=1 Tax=Algoriphagus aurantiacus TaxID=3103948 RepID=UPI002B3FA727|nr:toll/interleukin-1 receptor domain-containing protein [Algoriphagus sp. D3-2-R+10]MEB2774059.1 toll/interleukin-1 receptor domain-containing protein [Algoriphagus sp. D3-2-R+10]